MVETEGSQNFPQETVRVQNVFETTARSAPALIRLLQLAEREGAYAKLTPRRKEVLQKYYVEGLSLTQIAVGYGISKQAVSQSLRLIPESLYQQMLKDVNRYATHIGFTEISDTYHAYRKELEIRRAGQINLK